MKNYSTEIGREARRYRLGVTFGAAGTSDSDGLALGAGISAGSDSGTSREFSIAGAGSGVNGEAA